MRLLLLIAIHAYRWGLSPLKVALFGPLARCRFEPSCSAYALEAVQRHGAVGGFRLALGRLLRCHPWGGCGPDPVPAASPPGSFVPTDLPAGNPCRCRLHG